MLFCCNGYRNSTSYQFLVEGNIYRNPLYFTKMLSTVHFSRAQPLNQMKGAFLVSSSVEAENSAAESFGHRGLLGVWVSNKRSLQNGVDTL